VKSTFPTSTTDEGFKVWINLLAESSFPAVKTHVMNFPNSSGSTMNSTIIELSFHTCNFVLEVLDKEEPGTRVWQKFMSKLQPKIAIFQKISVSTCLLA